MEKIFVDTSGWVGLFVANDENHEKAVSIFENIKRGKMSIYTSDYVLDETITTILARGNHKQSVIAGKVLFTSEIIKIVFFLTIFGPLGSFTKSIETSNLASQTFLLSQ